MAKTYRIIKYEGAEPLDEESILIEQDSLLRAVEDACVIMGCDMDYMWVQTFKVSCPTAHVYDTEAEVGPGNHLFTVHEESGDSEAA